MFRRGICFTRCQKNPSHGDHPCVFPRLSSVYWEAKWPWADSQWLIVTACAELCCTLSYFHCCEKSNGVLRCFHFRQLYGDYWRLLCDVTELGSTLLSQVGCKPVMAPSGIIIGCWLMLNWTSLLYNKLTIPWTWISLSCRFSHTSNTCTAQTSHKPQ